MKFDDRPLAPALYLVSTPIGTARDITLRALDTLAAADWLVAEDTRTLRKLLDIHGIPLRDRRISAYHDHSGDGPRARIAAAVAEGRSVAYASEAGTPLLADPGYALAAAVRQAGGAVTAVPGASALLAALAVAGLPTDRFTFCGFLPATRAARRSALQDLAGADGTLVFYESPRRVREMLEDLRDNLGEREVAVCRELTKRFEAVRRGPVSAVLTALEAEPPKGEVVILAGRGAAAAPDDDAVEAALKEAMETMRIKDAATAVAGALGRPRREVYQVALKMKDRR